MPEPRKTPVAFAATGVANLASIMAAFRRAGAEPSLAATPEELAAAAVGSSTRPESTKGSVSLEEIDAADWPREMARLKGASNA